MKNTIEINGFTISIEDMDGVINIKAIFGDKEAGDLSLDPTSFTEESTEAPETQEDDMESNESLLDFEKFLSKK